MTPDDLFEQLSDPNRRGLPPVETWQPDREGSSEMRIDAQGRWFHQGGQIKREALVRVFSTILRREADHYFLVTPVEKLSIEVEDAPFLVVGMDVRGAGESQEIVFATHTDDLVIANAEHPIRVAEGPEVRPYVEVRAGLEALINRPVYYRLAELAVETPDGYGVWSGGVFFLLQWE
ncbi:MAG: DUF1285 domain-containing protein [Gammaproteobacteria bacterium]|nr:MAG: DUF1285 domain-containing protein [Gammaproteobacteria bacterium]